MLALIALHAVTGLSTIAAGRRWGRRAFLFAGIGPLVTLGWLLLVMPGVVDGDVLTQTVRWVPALDLELAVRLDGFAAMMALVVAGVGVAVFAYSLRYFPASGPALARLAGLLALFAGSMFGLVVADDMLLLYTFW